MAFMVKDRIGSEKRECHLLKNCDETTKIWKYPSETVTCSSIKPKNQTINLW
jgi:hypothetical protein